MKDTHQTGNRTEALVLARLLRIYDVVLIPFGYGQRYDMVIDDNGEFTRVQCKTGRLRDGCIIFNSSSTHWISKAAGEAGTRGYKGEADVFAVYCPDNDQMYMVPVKDVGETKVVLRLEPPRNGQKTGINMADKYLLPP